MTKPNARPGPAAHFAGTDERILELTNGSRVRHVGGLLNLRSTDSDPAHDNEPTLRVELYNLDDGVKVSVARARAEARTTAQVTTAIRRLLRNRNSYPPEEWPAFNLAIVREAALLVALLDGTEPPEVEGR